MHFFIPCACRNQKEAVNVYGPVVTCLRPDLVKAKLFMLPLNSLLREVGQETPTITLTMGARGQPSTAWDT